ncbi:hypothetical protein CCAX7_54220 [Capsulimonas corticalis]|uniref:Uncharacterized protein n=1 Tax=Capsulimonas corticalis TaxID=2219043 RepID=A0A402CN63_9BACT|nr:hypothetical protein [Capsulimonas corticalis]BDI33371.1 hypothetical protein CCAX7_54220 [Capsulimonas corticalis]
MIDLAITIVGKADIVLTNASFGPLIGVDFPHGGHIDKPLENKLIFTGNEGALLEIFATVNAQGVAPAAANQDLHIQIANFDPGTTIKFAKRGVGIPSVSFPQDSALDHTLTLPLP